MQNVKQWFSDMELVFFFLNLALHFSFVCFHAGVGMVLTWLLALQQIHRGNSNTFKKCFVSVQITSKESAIKYIPLYEIYEYFRLTFSESGRGGMTCSPPLEYAFHSTYYDLSVDPSPDLILTEMLMHCQRKRNLDIAHGR